VPCQSKGRIGRSGLLLLFAISRRCPVNKTAPEHTRRLAGAAEELGRHQLAYGRRVSKAELFARIDAVDADTVKAVAERFLYDKDVAIAAYGPTQGLPDYNWFRRRTFWLRY